MGFTFDVARGKVGYYSGLPAANDRLVWVPIRNEALSTVEVIRAQTDLGLIVDNSHATVADWVGRQTLAAVSWDFTTAPGEARLLADDITFTPSYGDGAADTIWAFVCYDPDSTAIPDDNNLIPLFAHDFVYTVVSGVAHTVDFPERVVYRTLDGSGP